MFKLATEGLRLLFWVHDNITHTVEPLSWIKILDKILSAYQRYEFEIEWSGELLQEDNKGTVSQSWKDELRVHLEDSSLKKGIFIYIYKKAYLLISTDTWKKQL